MKKKTINGSQKHGSRKLATGRSQVHGETEYTSESRVRRGTTSELVTRQLKTMQASPRASPVVMVRKKDRTHRFCEGVKCVTKPDSYPLPRIDDLLDQLGQSHYFSTLNLASGYCQVRVQQDSVPKTAFVTPQGLFEFRMMPFGFTNAPSVFQRLMQCILMGFNAEEGPDFVSVYIDDILIFLRTTWST